MDVWKCLGDSALEFLAKLYRRTIESERMPEEWRDSVLIQCKCKENRWRKSRISNTWAQQHKVMESTEEKRRREYRQDGMGGEKNGMSDLRRKDDGDIGRRMLWMELPGNMKR